MRTENEGSPMLISLSLVYEKGLFSGPLSSRLGGALRSGRRCADGVTFERENPQNKSLSAGQKDSKTDRRFGQRHRPQAQGPIRAVSVAQDRERFFAPRTRTGEYPARPREAQEG